MVRDATARWFACAFLLTILLVAGIWLLLASSFVGVMLVIAAIVGLIGMAALRPRATTNALWTMLEGVIAYVTGAWFWYRD
jgi:NADH:ubiquinone oxidoreductase subunit 6 (subunit J)